MQRRALQNILLLLKIFDSKNHVAGGAPEDTVAAIAAMLAKGMGEGVHYEDMMVDGQGEGEGEGEGDGEGEGEGEEEQEKETVEESGRAALAHETATQKQQQQQDTFASLFNTSLPYAASGSSDPFILPSSNYTAVFDSTSMMFPPTSSDDNSIPYSSSQLFSDTNLGLSLSNLGSGGSGGDSMFFLGSPIKSTTRSSTPAPAPAPAPAPKAPVAHPSTKNLQQRMSGTTISPPSPVVRLSSKKHSPGPKAAPAPMLRAPLPPIVRTAQLPIVRAAQLPIVRTAQLPIIRTAQLPIVRTAQLPIVRTAQLPMASSVQAAIVRSSSSSVQSPQPPSQQANEPAHVRANIVRSAAADTRIPTSLLKLPPPVVVNPQHRMNKPIPYVPTTKKTVPLNASTINETFSAAAGAARLAASLKSARSTSSPAVAATAASSSASAQPECDECSEPTKATSKCPTCGNMLLCDLHAQAHQRSRRTVDHALVSVPSA